jgi:hypothetical protein
VDLKGFNIGGWLLYENDLFYGGYEWPDETDQTSLSNDLDDEYEEGTGERFFSGIRNNFFLEEDLTVIAVSEP